MQPLVIIGAGGLGREIAWLVEEINQKEPKWQLIGFLDDSVELQKRQVNGYPVLGSLSWLEHNKLDELAGVCAVGSPIVKRHLVEQAKHFGLKFTTLIHPSAIISNKVKLGEGVIICAGCILTVDLEIGEQVILNPGCGIGHDVIIGRYATLFWHVDLAGRVKIEEGSLLGSKSTVIQGITVGAWSIIGAGAVVTRDIPPHCTAVGVPARPIKFHDQSMFK